MSFEGIKLLLTIKFGADIIIGEEISGLQPALLIDADRIADVCLELRNNPETYFDFLSSLSGVDYGVNPANLAWFIIWPLSRTKHN